ncbi:MAG: hypothetical protein HDR90_01035 [Bacteroides sp.]|nr:hypothetical protein [Bacteroides sp.]
MALTYKFHLLRPFQNLLGPCWRQIIKLRYLKAYHRFLPEKNPVTYHEKVLWLLLHSDLKEWAWRADKYRVRDYVARVGGEDLLPQLYGVYDNADEIDFDSLPQSFVLKTNNGCTTNLIVPDKSKLDIAATRRLLNSWLTLKYGNLTGERHYSLIEPKLICEEMLVDHQHPGSSLIDYKFNCFNGVPRSVTVYSDRVAGTHRKSYMVYDMDWNPMPEVLDTSCENLTLAKPMERPACFDRLKELAATFSRDFPYLRVDFYIIDGQPKFGELTFTPGFDTYYTADYYRQLGEMIEIPATMSR